MDDKYRPVLPVMLFFIERDENDEMSMSYFAYGLDEQEELLERVGDVLSNLAMGIDPLAEVKAD
jgi:hypothetical protein